ncbi:hypothetical protein M4914_19225, partial [Streptomyces somaliensis DSM 40738]|nr:hypothetical protein [Streptomyces somaliensis DSM 40738]
MRQLPAPVRWAVTAVAVMASAGSTGGCMSVSDDGVEPVASRAAVPSGTAAAGEGTGMAASGGGHEPRGAGRVPA